MIKNYILADYILNVCFILTTIFKKYFWEAWTLIVTCPILYCKGILVNLGPTINILLIDWSKVAENNKLLFYWKHCFTDS